MAAPPHRLQGDADQTTATSSFGHAPTPHGVVAVTTPTPPSLPRGLFVLVACLIVAHTAFNGIRITTSLAAIKAGGGALWVGLLTAMFNVIPAFLAIRVGRLVDRMPLKRPLIAGCIAVALGGAVAAAQPMLGVLALCACVIGVGWMVIAAASQYAVGLFGGTEQRVRAFSVMSMGFSISSFLGPLVAGFMIDHVSYQAAFGVLAVCGALPTLVFASGRVTLPWEPPPSEQRNGGVRELLAMPAVRNTLIIASFITVGWDLYIFIVPVLGSELGLSATEIGSTLSLFAVAVFVVRLFMTRLTARLGERGVMVSAMVLAGCTFLAFAFTRSYAMMLTLSFIIGLGLGASQPITLSILHEAAPPGRVGEVNGMRMTLIATSQWTMPLVFGVLSVSTGMLPLFLVIGGGMLSGSWFAKRKMPVE